MMRFNPFTRRIRDDVRGATIVELGFVMLPFTVVLLVIIDFGYRMYLGSVVEGTLHRAARRATVGSLTSSQVDDYVRSQLTAFSRHANISIVKRSYYEFSNVGKPEKITQDTAPFDSYNVGDCYEDMNGNGTYDTTAGTNGVGGSDDVIYYEVTADFPRLVPLDKFLGWNKMESVRANTVLRNQPFASQTIPNVKCT